MMYVAFHQCFGVTPIFSPYLKQAFRFFDRNLVGYIRVKFNHTCLVIWLWYYNGMVKRSICCPFSG